MAKELFEFSDHYREAKPAPLATNHTLETFEKATYREWVEQSGIDKDLYQLNVECVPDEVQGYGGDISRPIEDALNWNPSARWSLKGKARNYGAIISSYDGSIFQVKLSKPRTNKEGKTLKYETPLGTATKPFYATITFNIWLKVSKRQNVHNDTVVIFLYKYYSKNDYQDLNIEKVTTEFSPAQISAAFWEWVRVNNIPIKWCEGAKKACCLLSHGYVAIALSGVSNGYRTPKDEFKNKIGQSYLVEDVVKFVNGDRPHEICFDSDTKPKTVKGVNANIKTFGALINAKAKEVSKSKHVLNVVRVITWKPELGKGVDDLIVANGIEAFEAIAQRAKILNVWKIETERKLTQPVSLAVCRRYLGEVNIPRGVRLVVIKSAMGTGKTYTIAEAVKDKIGDPKHVVFVITHRDNLAVELGNRFGLIHRKDISSSNEGSLFGYVMCADSAHSKADPSFNPDDYAGKTITVIIDECESVAWHILSSNTDIRKHRPEILENLSKLLAMALSGNGLVFLADAHVSDRSVNFFHQLACQSKPELIELEPFVIANSFKFNETPWRVYPFSSKVPSFWKKQLDSHLEHKPDAKVLIQVESQKVHSKWSTQTIEKDLKAKFPDKKIVRVDSQTVINPDHPAYGAHHSFTKFCKNWDIVICSNVLESGVSIDLKGHFTSVWACIWGVSSPRQANQMLARLRDPVERYVWISPRAINNIGNGADNAYALLKSTDSQTKATIKALQQNGLGDFETDDGFLNLALKTWASYGAEINLDGRSLCESVLATIAADGHTVSSICGESDKDTNLEMESVRDENYDHHAKSIENQELIDDEQASIIETKKTRTEQEQQQLRKYKMQKTYGESTADTVKKDDDQWFSQLNLHYLLTIGSGFLMPKDVAKTQELERNGKGYALDLLKSTYWRKIKTLETIGILDLIPVNGEKLELYQGCELLSKFTQKVKKYRWVIKDVFGITLNPEWFGEKASAQENDDFLHENSHNKDRDSEDSKDVMIAKTMLRLLGAKLLPVGKKGRRGEQVRCYELVRDYKSCKEEGKRVYYGVVPWGGDNRYQVFDYWLERDTEYMAQQSNDCQNVHVDTVVPFLYKDINKKDYNNVTTEKMTTSEGSPKVPPISLPPVCLPVAISPSTPNAPKPNPPSPDRKPSNKPTQPPKNAIQWRKGMTAMYQGLDWVIGMLGTATAKIVRNGFELWVDIPDLALA
jgi:hypothetical protein